VVQLLRQRRPASPPHQPPATVTESSGDAGFHPYCDIGGNVERAQTFTAPRSGTLSEIDYTTFQSGIPNGPLTVRLDTVGPDGLPTGCYGHAYTDSNPYPSGAELYSSDGGAS
jgi:hypothetical protein